MSGLGISFDAPLMAQRSHQQHHRAPTRPQSSYASLSSAASSSGSDAGIPRRPASSVDRRVRIASGLPNIMGATPQSSQASPDSALDSASSISVSSTRSSGYGSDRGGGRTERLSAAVAKLNAEQDQDDDILTPASSYTSSVQDGASEASSARSSAARRAQTIRKQASQPILSRSSTIRFPQTIQLNAQTQAMGRSRSQMSLNSAYSGGAAQLGRTTEIGRGSQRGPRVRARTLESAKSAKEPRMVPDGFGGWAPADQADEQMNKASAERPEANEVPAFDGPALRADTAQQQSALMTSDNHGTQNVPGAMPRGPPQRPEGHQRRPATAQARFRVGSFYGANGEVTASLDSEGRLARPSPPASETQQSSIHSHRRSQSGGPRAQHMFSPPGSTSKEVSNLHGAENVVRMRSLRGFNGLEGAERGQSMVSLDSLHSSYQMGEHIVPGRVKNSDQESILSSARPSESDEFSGCASGTEVGPGDSISNVGGKSVAGGTPQGSGAAQQRNRVAAASAASSRPRSQSMSAAASNVSGLERHPTLLSQAGNTARRSRDLSRLLDPAATKAGKPVPTSGVALGSSVGSAAASSEVSSNPSDRLSDAQAAALPPAVLEQGRSGKARVDVDVVLESDLIVEGGMLRGRLEIKLRKPTDKKAAALMLAQPKIRIVGFEELLNDDTRHIFYHHATAIDGDRSDGGPSEPYVLHGSPDLCSPQAEGRAPLPCFASAPDSEGYYIGAEGNHSIPFTLEMPVGKGAKGAFRGKHAVVRYIVIGSVKLKDADGSNRSIAHFYRHVELFPYLNPAVVLSSASKPVQARASKSLFLGGSGKVHLTASLHRSTWVAGQRVYVNININNDTSKRLKNITLALVRTVVLFRPRPELDLGKSVPDKPHEAYVDPDACNTATSRKKISEETLEMGQKGTKGSFTAKGWWTGVEAHKALEFSHYMRVPSDALSISRGRHVEVTYSVKVSVSSSLSADVSVELPLRVINFVSLDPPPLKAPKWKNGADCNLARSWNSSVGPASGSSPAADAPLIERVRSAEALRSPQRMDYGPASSHLPLPSARAEQQYQQQQHLKPPEATSARRLQHQKSLDFINHAIRSATARRGGAGGISQSNLPMGLGIDVPEGANSEGEADNSSPQDRSGGRASSGSSEDAIDPSCLPFDAQQHQQMQQMQHMIMQQQIQAMGYGVPVPLLQVASVPLDDVDDDSDDGQGYEDERDRTLNLNDESVDEVQEVIGSAQLSTHSPDFVSSSNYYASSLAATSVDEADLSDESIDAEVPSTETPREDDEYDEEEERLQARLTIMQQREATRLQQAQHGQMANAAVISESQQATDSRCDEDDDARTPIARSPSKMAPLKHEATPSSQVPAAKLQQERSLPRKGSNLTRTSNVKTASRPPSPSKSAPAPTKSALKGKSSFTFATADAPLKSKSATAGSSSLTAGPVAHFKLRAKVAPSQMAEAIQASPSNSSLASPRKTTESRRQAVPASPTKANLPKTLKKDEPNQGKRQVSNARRESCASSTASIDTRSSSPASSASEARTPESACEELPSRIVDDAGTAGVGDETLTALRAHVPQTKQVITTPTRSSSAIPEHSPARSNLTPSQSADRLHRSESTMKLRGSSIVVPSVRDKIAMLEHRKTALRDFRGESCSPNTTPTRNAASLTPGGTPGSEGRVASASAALVARTSGSREGEMASSPNSHRIQRKGSMLSVASNATEASSASNGLRRAPSVMSFRAPLFKTEIAPPLPGS
ncbi:ARRESTIN DOMAIN CONTAINING PROTEIN [Ceraceosorus bombacis]|uniref:ARRESTIN DOMAIN CONTAINING PROTEIN n=1 Tax=Ceraceosorus bombacis TaxID=401625 RepID=A0A0P1BTM1_9BASI|nr:ARRESTIN DOMAIN CONTAINING PROTEIN [Ceraceosorus bombacis]